MGIQKTRNIGLALLWCVCAAGCGASNEEAPLVDGLQLQYEFRMGGEVAIINVAVKEDGSDHFILEISTETDDEEAKKSEIRVDRYFKTKSGKLATLIQHPLWLPPSMRESGAEIVADGSLSMRRDSKTWEGRNVLVAGGGVALGLVEWYYDKETGFLVGSHAESMGTGMSVKLVKSNVPGL